LRRLAPRRRYNELKFEVEEVPGDRELITWLSLICELCFLTLLGLLAYALIAARYG